MGARESTVTEIQNLLGWKRPSGSSSPTIIFARHLCPSASSLCLPPHFPSLFRLPIFSSFSLLPPRAAALLCPWQAACRMADVHSSRLLCQEQSSPNAAAEWQLLLCFITSSQVRNSEPNPLGGGLLAFSAFGHLTAFSLQLFSQILEQFNQRMRKSDQFLMSTH